MYTALFCIDMQTAYFRNRSLEIVRKKLVERCNQLIREAHTNGVPIFNIITEHERDRSTWTLNMLDDQEGYLFRDGRDAKPVEGLEVKGTEMIIKTRDSAFFDTQLAELLAKRGIRQLIICGVSTHGCILQTAADAYAHNIRIFLAVEAIGTHDPRFHQLTLDMLTQEYRQTQLKQPEALKMLASDRSSQPRFSGAG